MEDESVPAKSGSMSSSATGVQTQAKQPSSVPSAPPVMRMRKTLLDWSNAAMKKVKSKHNKKADEMWHDAQDMHGGLIAAYDPVHDVGYLLSAEIVTDSSGQHGVSEAKEERE